MKLSFLYYLVLFSYLLKSLRNILFFAFIFQLKEYRWDRIKSFSKTTGGRKIFFPLLIKIKFLLLLLILTIYLKYYFNIFDSLSLFLLLISSYILFFAGWIIEAVHSLHKLINKGWKIPVLTLKSLTLVSLVIYLVILQPLLSDRFLIPLLIWPVYDLLLPVFFLAVIFFLSLPTLIYKKYLILRASRKIKECHRLRVIGVTGSYGKTSVKEFTAQLLDNKYQTLKTSDYNNTLPGIAKTINHLLTRNHELFVVEMGAYKQGEIQEICRLVRPRIGILTGINSQHLELFGSWEKLKQAKFELMESLQADSIAIFNENNKEVKDLMLRLRQVNKDIKIYSYKSVNNLTTSINTDIKKTLIADNIKIYPQSSKFDINWKNHRLTLHIPLPGFASVENILPAILVFLILGNDLSELPGLTKKLKLPLHSSRLYHYNNRVMVIDDTFNANLTGTLAALKYMSIFKGKKYFILTPLIELGENELSAHKLLGREMAKVCDQVILTNNNFLEAVSAGFQQTGLKRAKPTVYDNRNFAEFKEEADKLPENSVIYFSGKEAEKILNRLINHV